MDIIEYNANSVRRFTDPNYSKLTVEKQFIPIPFDVLDNPFFREDIMSKKRFATYLWLRRKVIRGEYSYDNAKHMVFREYYLKEKLATAMPLSRLATDLQMPMSKVSGHVLQLEEDGLIQIHYHDRADYEGNQGCNVYVLGEIINKKETWFLDKKYSKKRRDN